MDDSSKPSSQGSRGVRVDLGDDLLRDTSFISTSQSLEQALDPQDSVKGDIQASKSLDPAEWLRSAEILLNEGFSKDAKRLLHQVLIRQPDNIQAEVFLNKIRASEEQALLDERHSPRVMLSARPIFQVDENPDDVIRNLNQTFDLGLFDEQLSADSQGKIGGGNPGAPADDAWVNDLIQRNPDATAQDWIDLGIGFFEMEINPIASKFFLHASRCIDAEAPDAGLMARSVCCLLALSLIQQGKPFDAFIHLEPMIRSFEIRTEDKVELFYLMGRAYDLMNKPDLAHEFYLQVWNLIPNYRDIETRLKEQLKKP